MASAVFDIKPQDGWVQVTAADANFIRIRSTTNHGFFVESSPTRPAATVQGYYCNSDGDTDDDFFATNGVTGDFLWVRTSPGMPEGSKIHVYAIAGASGGGGGGGGAVTIANGADVTQGAKADAPATNDTGTFSLIALFKRLLQSTTSLIGKFPDQYGGRMPVNAGNFATTFRDAFQTYDTTNTWTTASVGESGDFIQVDGNAAGASYLVLSKNPLVATGAELSVESQATFIMPIELSIGAHLSQRTLGQEFAIEMVSTETPDPAPSELTVSTMSQGTTTLTVTTTAAHGLRVGQRIGIYGCADSRMNYASLVVASTPSITQFTATAGPGGAIPSVTAGPFTSGFVYIRSAMNRALNGSAMLFENATATQATFYAKSENGDATPIGGTFAGNHAVTVGTTSSVQPVAAFNNYNFRPTTEYRLAQMADRLQWHDAGVDATGQTSARATITQVIPNNTKDYKIRFRARNNKGLTIPVAKIVSVAKSGTTTATVVTDVAHGLTTGDLINTYGVRDQTNFANLTTATAVASVVNATTFTVVWGSAVTATSFGGSVSRVQGGQVQQGAIAQSAQSATIASSILTLVGSAAWAGLLVGDYVNLYGCRDNSVGADVGIDGVFRVRDIQTTSLVLEPINGTVIPATLGTTNCGGTVLKRTDLRLSFVRLFDFERLRIEALSRPSGDVAGAMPVQVANTPAVTLSSGTVTTVTTLTGGNAAEDAATTANPLIMGGVVRTATSPTTLVAGDAARVTMTSGAAAVVYPFAVPEVGWQFTGVLTNTTAVAARVAGAAGIRNYVTGVQYQNTSATATTVLVLDGATTIAQFNAPANMALPATISFDMPIRGTAATALNVNCGTTASNILINVQGFQAA